LRSSETCYSMPASDHFFRHRPGPRCVNDEPDDQVTLAERIGTQKPKDKNKLYTLHATEAECISKGKSRRPYEFGVKASIAVTHKQGLNVGARTLPGSLP